jgi:hypothetical protein
MHQFADLPDSPRSGRWRRRASQFFATSLRSLVAVFTYSLVLIKLFGVISPVLVFLRLGRTQQRQKTIFQSRAPQLSHKLLV